MDGPPKLPLVFMQRDGWVGGREISLSHQQLLLYQKMALPSALSLRFLASIFFHVCNFQSWIKKSLYGSIQIMRLTFVKFQQ